MLNWSFKTNLSVHMQANRADSDVYNQSLMEDFPSCFYVQLTVVSSFREELFP